jgi:Spy/CpxP family protein refolding chaperone
VKAFRIAALGAALMVGGASLAQAQTSTPPGPPQGGGMQRGGQGRMMMLMRGIELNDAQRAKMDSIGTSYRAQMPRMTPGEMPDSATRARRREMMDKQMSDVRGLLTADQQKTFDANVAEMRSRMQERQGGGQPPQA